jgi:hypothetical protein
MCLFKADPKIMVKRHMEAAASELASEGAESVDGTIHLRVIQFLGLVLRYDSPGDEII